MYHKLSRWRFNGPDPSLTGQNFHRGHSSDKYVCIKSRWYLSSLEVTHVGPFGSPEQTKQPPHYNIVSRRRRRSPVLPRLTPVSYGEFRSEFGSSTGNGTQYIWYTLCRAEISFHLLIPIIHFSIQWKLGDIFSLRVYTIHLRSSIDGVS